MTRQMIKRSANLTMLCLYISYYMASTSFYHIHYCDGDMIAHSHICSIWNIDSATPAPNPHTEAQLQSIALLMDIILVGALAMTVFFVMKKIGTINPKHFPLLVYRRIRNQHGRAPPAFFG